MEELLAELIREVRGRHFGKHRGFVVDNQDPEQRARVRVRVPSVLGETDSAWAMPCMPFGGLADQGMMMVPEVDAMVWVEFEAGDVSHPIWTGTSWEAADSVPSEGALSEPTTRVLKTPSGHVLQFDDAEGKEQFRLHHPRGAELTIDKEGTVALTDAGGSRLKLDAKKNEVVLEDSHGNALTMDSRGVRVVDKSGNKIEMAASGVTVSAQKIVIDGAQVKLGGLGGEPLIKGQSFLALFATHLHTSNIPGFPSSPPIPQGEMSTLSRAVTTK